MDTLTIAGALEIFYLDICALSVELHRCVAHARSFLWSATFGTMSLTGRTKAACVTTEAPSLLWGDSFICVHGFVHEFNLFKHLFSIQIKLAMAIFHCKKNIGH